MVVILERVVYYTNAQYSDSGSIEECVVNWLIEKGLIDKRNASIGGGLALIERNYDYCQSTRTHIETVITWVERKKDL